MGLQLQDLLVVVFDLCYYGHQQYGSVLEMEVSDMRWLHGKLNQVKQEEIKALQKGGK